MACWGRLGHPSTELWNVRQGEEIVGRPDGAGEKTAAVITELRSKGILGQAHSLLRFRTWAELENAVEPRMGRTNSINLSSYRLIFQDSTELRKVVTFCRAKKHLTCLPS